MREVATGARLLATVRTPASAGSTSSSSALVVALLAFAIACLGVGAAPASALRRPLPAVVVLREQHVRITALGITSLGAAVLAILFRWGG